jgi:hypothetical protein
MFQTKSPVASRRGTLATLLLNLHQDATMSAAWWWASDTPGTGRATVVAGCRQPGRNLAGHK